MLQPTDYFFFVSNEGSPSGRPEPPASADIRINGVPVISQYFLRPTSIGNVSIGINAPDSELASYYIYRVWIDNGDDDPNANDLDYVLEQGVEFVDLAEERVERIDYWRPYTAQEIDDKKTEKLEHLDHLVQNRNAEVNHHIGNAEDGIDLLKDILIAGKEVAEQSTRDGINMFGDWLRDATSTWPAQYQLDPPAATENGAGGSIKINMTGAAFIAQIRERQNLADLDDIRVAEIDVRNEINALTTVSEMINYDTAYELDVRIHGSPIP